MLKLLLAVDNSDSSLRATEHVVRQAGRCKEPVEMHLLNVQLPVVGVNVKLLVSHEDLEAYYRDESMAALKNAREKLEAAGIRYALHRAVGSPAETIVQYAEQERCEQIVMGTRGLGAVSSLVLGSVANKVVHIANMPVVLVK